MAQPPNKPDTETTVSSAADSPHAFAFLRMFAGAIAIQAMLSATNFVVALLLIRYTPTREYGYYVLVLNSVTLLVGVQTSFIRPELVLRLVRGTPSQRSDLIGGLYRGQLSLWPAFAAIAVVAVLLIYLLGHLPPQQFWLLCAGTFAVLGSLYREFFRMVLFAYRLPLEVLKGDLIYTLLLIGGAVLAAFAGDSASITISSLMGVAALCGGIPCARSLWRHESWNISGEPGILRKIAPHGMWTTSGTVIHWILTQGSNFMVAGVLNVAAVGAIATTRLLIMPLNMLSTGIGAIMMPTTTRWLDAHGASTALRRLLSIVGGLSVLAICYFGLCWLARDWIFAHIIRKQIQQRDTLILLWFGVGVLMLMRDQMLYLPLARARYATLTFVTSSGAVVALAVCYFGMHLMGVTGAVWGVLIGEAVNVSGLLTLSILETRRRPLAAAA
jgi:O-antigen/teichoic acid export membrane protein